MRDERAVLGFLLLHVLVAVPGALLLMALGLLRARPVAVLAASGPAFLLGVATVGLPIVLLLTLGVAVGTAVSLAVLAAVAVAFAVLALRRRRDVPAPAAARPPAVETAIERTLLAGVAVYLAFGALAFANLQTLWDDANIWSLKGVTLFHHESLIADVFRNPQLSVVHLDYPILQPVLEASFFRALGHVDLRLWHMELWVLFGSVVWTLAWLLAPLGRRWLWAIVLGLVAVSPIAVQNVTLGDADLTMAGLIGCGALSFGIWLDRGHRAHALLGALLVGAAANVKNEGLAFGLAIFLALGAVLVLGRRRKRLRELAAAGGIVVAMVLPWLLWVGGNPDARRATPSPWDLIDRPGYLVDRIDFLWRGVGQVLEQMVATQWWGLLVPAFIVAAGTLIAIGRSRPVAAFYALAWLLTALVVVYTYWVTPIADLGGFEGRTGPRVVLGVLLVAAAGLAHLVQLAGEAATTEPVDALAEPEARERVTAETQPIAR